MDGILSEGKCTAGQLMTDTQELLDVLHRAARLLDWEGESIIPKGPDEALVEYMARHRRAAAPLTLVLLHSFRRLYGAGVARIRRQVDRYTNALERFAEFYGPGPVAIGRAPARINILGEHVDYVKYLPTEVLPFASREHDMLILFRTGEDSIVRGRSTLEGTPVAEFSLDHGPSTVANPAESIDERWLDFLSETGTPERHWINYVKASVFYCRAKYPGVNKGFDFLVDSTLPAAGGASSSSAVVVLGGAAIRVSNNIPLDPETLAQDSARAEWYIGTRGGNMDHCTMCLSSRQSALHLNFTPFQFESVPLHRFRYRWMTFFAHPADKGGDVLREYNERSAVSRLLIPALLDRMLAADPEAKARWERAVSILAEDTENLNAADEAREILNHLPEAITLAEVRTDFPEIFEVLERSYPLLAESDESECLFVRPRALHHVGEVTRVRQVVAILKEIFASRMPEESAKTEPGLRAVGDLITEAHESMRDLYGLTTPDIDELVEIILGHSGVYGARLMGGGFGGNVLVLVSKEHVAELVARVQKLYYAPRERDGAAEGSVMVSTPGEGFGLFSPRDSLRHSVINGSAIWWKWDRYAPVIEGCICSLLGIETLGDFAPKRPIQPIVIAGGRGKAGQETPSLNVLAGRTSLEHVMRAIEAMPFPTLPPIVVVSHAMNGQTLAQLKLPQKTRFVVQDKPLGTGHAVLAALGDIADPEADALVVWGSQPLLSPETLARSIIVHQALGSKTMLFPTAVTRTPYAPIQRNLHGYVVASRETSIEGTTGKRLGETNVGAFVIGADTLAPMLKQVDAELFDAKTGTYATKSGTLGFPNEMARALVNAGKPVIALPIARVEESLGVRSPAGYEEAKRIIAKS